MSSSQVWPEEEETVNYSKSPEWADISPIPQDDGQHPVCVISYTPEYSNAMDYYRAICLKQEFSHRVLSLTRHILLLNAAHYSIWYYRQRCVEALKSNLRHELELVDTLAFEHAKGYQLWRHRPWVMETWDSWGYGGAGENPETEEAKKQRIEGEFRFIQIILEEDSKNYHAWTYRQWLVKRYQQWEREWNFSDLMIQQDLRNNSAWNQRYFILFFEPESQRDQSVFQELLMKEMRYAMDYLNVVVNNESAWNYLVGLSKKYAGNKQFLFEFLEDLTSKPHNAKKRLLLRGWVEVGELWLDGQAEGERKAEWKKQMHQALGELAEVDLVRREYWRWKKAQLT